MNTSTAWVDVAFHGYKDKRITLAGVSYVSDLGFNQYAFHAVQSIHQIVSEPCSAHIFGTNVTLPRNSNGSYLRAICFPPRTAGAKRKPLTCKQTMSCGSDENIFRLLLQESTGIYVCTAFWIPRVRLVLKMMRRVPARWNRCRLP